MGCADLHDPFSVCRFSFLVQQHPYDDELFPLSFSFADFRFSFLVQQYLYDDELFPLGFSFAD